MAGSGKIQVTTTAIHDVLVIEPKVFGDERGWFTESFNANDFTEATGLNVDFVQDNHSFSRQWTLRGLHYQMEKSQGEDFLIECNLDKKIKENPGTSFSVFNKVKKERYNRLLKSLQGEASDDVINTVTDLGELGF